jgi:two-component system cell cycle response regulator DivK
MASQLILVVEDNVLVAKFFRLALERVGGYRCLVTETVAEMLPPLEAGEIHLAVIDVSLSNTQWEGRPIDGLELTRLLKRRTVGPLPVILATAHTMPGDRERFLAASRADDYIQKPVYDADEFVGRIRQLLERKA